MSRLSSVMHITYITWWLTAVRCHARLHRSMHLWLYQHDLIASQSPLTTTSYPSSVIGHWKVYWHLHNMFSYLINLPIRMVTGVYGSLPYLIRLYLPSPKTLYHFAKWFMSKTPYLPIISGKLYRKFSIKFVYQLQRNISWQKRAVVNLNWVFRN